MESTATETPATSNMCEVTHYTTQEAAKLIEESGAIRAGSYVTIPNQIPPNATAAEVERILEIRSGAGAMSYTTKVPLQSLVVPPNGTTTSGGAVQFQTTEPIPLGPGSFVPTGQ